MSFQTIVLKDASLTSTVWASREGIVNVRPIEDQLEMEAVTVSTNERFNPARDYVVRVVKKGGRPEVQHIAGKAPRWATFPQQWASWVQDGSVRASAAEYIAARVPEAQESVTVAMRKTGKQRSIDAWLEVARLCGVPEGKVRAAGTWTAVRAMPVRIAQHLSGKAPRCERWQPPVARPIYQDPAKSGRVLVAAPKGEAIRSEATNLAK